MLFYEEAGVKLSCEETDAYKFISTLISFLFTEEQLISGNNISGRSTNNSNLAIIGLFPFI